MEKFMFLFISLALCSCAGLSKKENFVTREPSSEREWSRGTGNIGNGGDVIYCKKSSENNLNGIYVLDEALANHDGVFTINYSNKFMTDLILKLKKHTFLGYDLEYFYDVFKKRNGFSVDNTIMKWIPNDEDLINVDDAKVFDNSTPKSSDETAKYIRSIPKNCSIKQAVINSFDGNYPIKLYFHNKTINELISKNKIDWLIIHEFLWNYLRDAREIREVNEILHDKNIFNFSESEITTFIKHYFGDKKSAYNYKIAEQDNFVFVQNLKTPMLYSKEKKFRKAFYANNAILLQDDTRFYVYGFNMLQEIDLAVGDNVVESFNEMPYKKNGTPYYKIIFKDKTELCLESSVHYSKGNQNEDIPDYVFIKKLELCTDRGINDSSDKPIDKRKQTNIFQNEDIVVTQIYDTCDVAYKRFGNIEHTSLKSSFTCKILKNEDSTSSLAVVGTTIVNNKKNHSYVLLRKITSGSYGWEGYTGTINHTDVDIDSLNGEIFFHVSNGKNIGIYNADFGEFLYDPQPMKSIKILGRKAILNDLSNKKGYIHILRKDDPVNVNTCMIDTYYDVDVKVNLKQDQKGKFDFVFSAKSNTRKDTSYSEERFKELCIPIK